MKRLILLTAALTLLGAGCAKTATSYPPPPDTASTALERQALVYCTKSNVDSVYFSEDLRVINVVSSLADVYSTYYRTDGSAMDCPVVNPDLEDAECRKLREYDEWRIACIELSAPKGKKIIYRTNRSNPQENDNARKDCERRGGQFHPCGSTCAPNAEVCTQECALTCEF